MKTIILFAAAAATLGVAAPAAAQSYGRPGPQAPTCTDHNHRPGDRCVCDEEHDFYRPGGHGGPGGGYGPGGPGGGGYGTPPWNIVADGGPGIRVRGRPVYVPSGVITIQGPPIYVEAPPIRIAPTQIYLNPPDVHVTPSDVTVEPPQIHFNGCSGGTACEPAGSSYKSPN